jgi:acetyl-CoA carboxylase carboxyl transferase subunit beta
LLKFYLCDSLSLTTSILPSVSFPKKHVKSLIEKEICLGLPEKIRILTPTEAKREAPDGLWYQCPSCKKVMHTREHRLFAWTCSSCNYHEKIGSQDYFELLFDQSRYTELDAFMSSGDPLKFEDTKRYPDRIKATEKKTGLKDAVRTAHGKMNDVEVVIAAMDFSFIGGSMGSVVGEKIARAIDYSLKHKIPFLMISKSGGARMMEAGFSLMQMAKTSAKLALLAEAKIPYVSLLTDPTTGGVTASYAMLGDFNISEPGALIGFASSLSAKLSVKTFQKDSKVLSLY